MVVTAACVFWCLLALAIVSLISGNPTAINGVIGAGFGAVTFTVLAVVDRRHARLHG